VEKVRKEARGKPMESNGDIAPAPDSLLDRNIPQESGSVRKTSAKGEGEVLGMQWHWA